MARNRNRSRMMSANRTSNAQPRRQRVPRTDISNGVCTVVGSEQVGTLVLSSVGTPGSFSINPLALTGTWLQRQASLYNKYKYVRASLKFVPFVPTSTPGRVIIAWGGDVVDDNVPTSGSQVSQYQNARETPVWMETTTNMGASRKPEYTVSTDSNTDTTQGEFITWTDFGTGTTGVNVGSLYLEYTVQFWSRAAFALND